jgi:peptidoglycan hydrolase-like protein with peptidoglycan-binding domain
VAVDGTYGAETVEAVRGFQASEGLAPSGELDDATWRALLERPPVPIDWSRIGSPAGARVAGTTAVPDSASLEALRFEVPLTPGQP